MTRQDKLLKYIDKAGLGLEIGPSYSPIAPKRDGFNVIIVDVKDQDQLREHYKQHHVNTDNIEKVDYIWRGETYRELLGQSSQLHWIIASHVIEHSTDLIGFLNNCDEILRDDGVLAMAIPDKRVCFDYFRPITGLGKVIDTHLNSKSYHSPGTVMEFMLNATRRGGQIAWDMSNKGAWDLICTVDDAKTHLAQCLKEPSLVDAHAWCFTPTSFRLLINDLHTLGFIKMKEVAWLPTEGCEFFAVLGRAGNPLMESRLDLLQQIQRELEFRQ